MVFLLLVTGCQVDVPGADSPPANLQPGEVAFSYAAPDAPALVVPVTINGVGPFDLVLDTGATITCIDSVLRDSLDLPEGDGLSGLGMGVGSSSEIDIVMIDSMQVGSATVGKMPVCVIDLQQFRSAGMDIHGLLGLNFLRGFKVTLDFEREVMRLEL